VKAAFASNDAPKEKHVRRIVLAAIRQPDMASNIVTFLLNRPWQSDPRIAGKVVYAVLLIAQYSVRLTPIIPFAARLQEIVQVCQSLRAKRKTAWTSAAVNLATVTGHKLALHREFGQLEGNLAGLQEGPALTQRLREYIAQLNEHAHYMVQLAATGGDFAMNVLTYPVVDELSSAFTLLRFIDETADELRRAGLILTRARQLPFLDSAVEYPDPVRHAPLPRMLVAD
jgi:hypothetical protein